MRQARVSLQLVAMGAYVYAIGGEDGKGCEAVVECYSIVYAHTYTHTHTRAHAHAHAHARIGGEDVKVCEAYSECYSIMCV
jgi:hypothetical protein